MNCAIRFKSGMHLVAFCVAVTASWNSDARIIGDNSKAYWFGDGTQTALAVWSSDLTFGADGLHRKEEEPQARKRESMPEANRLERGLPAWIQTSPMTVGMAWRPTPAVRVYLTSFGGGGVFPFDAHVRYGCDGLHWSSWQKMDASSTSADFGGLVGTANKEAETEVYAVDIKAPQADYEAYATLWRKWHTEEGAVCCDDEGAFLSHLLRTEPDFCKKRIPFPAYVQFRLIEKEPRAEKDWRLSLLYAEAHWGVGGLHSCDVETIDKMTDKRYLDLAMNVTGDETDVHTDPHAWRETRTGFLSRNPRRPEPPPLGMLWIDLIVYPAVVVYMFFRLARALRHLRRRQAQCAG